MTSSPGLFALTRRRFATPRSAALVIVALTALAAFVLAAAPRALVGVVREEVAHQISGVPATSRDLTAQTTGVPLPGPAGDPAVTEGWDAGAAGVFGALAQQLADARAGFGEALRPLTGPAEFAQFSDPVRVDPASLPADAPLSEIQLLAEPVATAAVEIVEGALPTAWDGSGAIPIALSATAAQAMQWPVGEVRCAATPEASAPDEATCVVLAGTIAATDPDAERWAHLPTALTATVFDDGNNRPVATSVAWVDPATWPALLEVPLGRLYLLAWYPVDGAAAVTADPPRLLAAVRAATTAPIALDAAGQQRTRLESELTGVLGAALGRADAAGAILAVAAVGPLAVSVALVVLASSLIIRRRRTDLALMSARGAPLSRLRRLLFGEGLLLGLPAAAIAVVAAVALTPFDAGIVPLVAALAIGIAPALALAFSLRESLLTRERADLDAPVRSRARGIVELLVVLLAVLAVGQLVLRGVGTAGEGIDPLVVLAPLLATVALALLFVRLHPVPIAAALRVSRRGRGVVGLVGTARNLRDPAAGTTAVLAMLVAVAIAVFSSVILATVDRGAVVAAERTVGADVQLSGPYFDEATVARMQDVSGVSTVTGVMRGDYLAVTGAGSRESALAVVTDVEALSQIQRGMVGGLPVGLISPGADPIEVASSTAVADRIGDVTAIADVTARSAGSLDRVLGLTASAQFVLMDAADYQSVTGRGFFPRTVYVDVAADADPAAVADELGEIVGAAHSVRLLEASTAEIQASPAVTALRIVLLSALGLAVALSVVAVLLVAGVSQEARSRVIALLRSMGLDRRRSRGIVTWEFAPLGVTALVGGILLGAVLPLLVVLSIDLRPFTGGGGQPALAVDPVLTGTLIAVVVIALALAVVIGVLGARTTSMAAVLRTEGD